MSHTSKATIHTFKHPSKRGVVTVTYPCKDFPVGMLKSIERQAGLRFGKR